MGTTRSTRRRTSIRATGPISGQSTLKCPAGTDPCTLIGNPAVVPGEQAAVLFAGWGHASGEPNGKYVFRYTVHGTLNGEPDRRHGELEADLHGRLSYGAAAPSNRGGSALAGDRVALHAAGIGRRDELAVLALDRAHAAQRPRRRDGHVVPARAEASHHVGADALLDEQRAR